VIGFSFFDDSFAVGRRRVRELCTAITGIGAPVWWTEIRRADADDAALDRNFFRHPPHRLDRIRQGLVRKAELTIGTQRRRSGAVAAAPIGVPAAGAR
jgi:hypothetical protein